MKEPWDWEEDDLVALVRQRTAESLTLDFKASEALDVSDKNRERTRTSISKDVSAFANSTGGTIVYGIAENPATHVAERIDAGLDPAIVSAEWIEGVIRGTIQQRIDGVRIRGIPLRKSAPGRVSYAVHVPASPRAPHQASDRRFYKRFDFSSVPMEEYEVRDVANRQAGPDLRVVLVPHLEPPVATLDRPSLVTALENESDHPAEHAFVELWVEPRIRVSDPGTYQPTYHTALSGPLGSLGMRAFGMPWSARSGLPVFRDLSLPIAQIPFAIDLSDQTEGVYLMRWEVKAPRMRSRHGFFNLSFERNKSLGIDSTRVLPDAEVMRDSRYPWVPSGGVITFGDEPPQSQLRSAT